MGVLCCDNTPVCAPRSCSCSRVYLRRLERGRSVTLMIGKISSSTNPSSEVEYAAAEEFRRVMQKADLAWGLRKQECPTKHDAEEPPSPMRYVNPEGDAPGALPCTMPHLSPPPGVALEADAVSAVVYEPHDAAFLKEFRAVQQEHKEVGQTNAALRMQIKRKCEEMQSLEQEAAAKRARTKQEQQLALVQQGVAQQQEETKRLLKQLAAQKEQEKQWLQNGVTSFVVVPNVPNVQGPPAYSAFSFGSSRPDPDKGGVVSALKLTSAPRTSSLTFAQVAEKGSGKKASTFKCVSGDSRCLFQNARNAEGRLNALCKQCVEASKQNAPGL